MSTENNEAKPKNKGGRPKGSLNAATKVKAETAIVVAELSKQFSPEAVKTLAKIMNDKMTPAGTRVAAANAILDRAIGKPKQQSEVTHTGTVSIAHILEKIAQKGVDLNDID